MTERRKGRIMAFQSINEIEKFSFEDCKISNFRVMENHIYMELEALIVKPDNSQNTNYTESYAATTTVKLAGGRILAGIKDGFKYYDANDVLIKEVPDEELNEEQLKVFTVKCEGAYLYALTKEKEEKDLCYYTMGVEFADEEDNTTADSYQLKLCFEKAVFSWDTYLNRVQR